MFTVDVEGTDRVLIRLSDFPRELRSEMRPALLQGGRVIATEMRRRAMAGGSSRIPEALYVRASFAVGPRQGVSIGVDHRRAPHAYVHAKTRPFRHPVHGTDRWVTQTPINYWQPSIVAKAGEARRHVIAAVEAAARRSA